MDEVQVAEITSLLEKEQMKVSEMPPAGKEVTGAAVPAKAGISESGSPAKKPEEKADKLADIIACNESYFAPLYKLLIYDFHGAEHEQEIKKRTWMILSRIPINKGKYDAILKIYEINPIPWNSVFCFAYPYGLLYSLKIVKSIMHNKSASQEWLSCFITMDGFTQFCKLCVEVSEPHIKINNKTIITCIEEVIGIIKEILEEALLNLDCEMVKKMIQKRRSIKVSQSTSKTVEEEKKANGATGGTTEKVPEAKMEEAKAEKMADMEDGGLAGWVKMEIDKSDLCVILLKLLQKLSEEKEIKDVVPSIKQAWEVMSDLLLADPKNLKIFLEDKSENLKKYLQQEFIESDHDDVKVIIINSIETVFDFYEKYKGKSSEAANIFYPKHLLYNMLIVMLPKFDQDCSNCESYFNVICELARVYNEKAEGIAPIISEDKLREILVENIMKRLTCSIEFKNPLDKVLAGYLMLLWKIKPIPSQPLASILLSELYDINTNSKSSSSISSQKYISKRKAAYKPLLINLLNVLQQLCTSSNEIAQLLAPRIIAFHDEQLKNQKKNLLMNGYSSEIGIKNPNDYVGLKNFGCTCYMNSLLQQLFMMPELRYSILSLPTEILPEKYCDKVTIHLQQIFASLLFSQQQYHAPKEFCSDFKYYGKTVDVSQQQDVDEFFNLLTDKLDSELETIGKKRMLRDIIEVSFSS